MSNELNERRRKVARKKKDEVVSIQESVASPETPEVERENGQRDDGKYFTRNTQVTDLTIPLAQITSSPENPRKHFDEQKLQELADSIKASGLLEPLIVRRLQEAEAASFEIIAGERRYRACKIAGMEEVPCRILDGVDDKHALELSLIENLQRDDLDPIEEAAAYLKLKQLGYKETEIGKRIGKHQSTIANSIRLLDLPDEIKEHVSEGRISASHARGLLTYAAAPKALDVMTQVALSGAPCRQVEDPEKNIHELTNRGAAIQLWTGRTDLDWKRECAGKCDKYRSSGGGNEGICLDPECFDQKSQEASDKRIAKEKKKREAAAQSGEIFTYDEFRKKFGYSADCLDRDGTPSACREDCDKRVTVLQTIGDNEYYIPYCIDSECHRKLKASDTRAKNKSKREGFRQAEIEMIKKLGRNGDLDKLAIIVCWEHLKQAPVDVLRAVCAEKELPFDADFIRDYHYGEKDSIYKLLNFGISPIELMRFAAEVVMRSEVHNSIKSSYENMRFTKFFLDDGQPEEEAFEGPRCVVCGCTEHHACVTDEGPCSWVCYNPPFCSVCLDKRIDEIRAAQETDPGSVIDCPDCQGVELLEHHKCATCLGVGSIVISKKTE